MAKDQGDEIGTGSPQPGSIEQLFASLESPLLHYALRLTGIRCLAEDVIQEAFMRLHTQFDEVREPRPWLYRTVHNLALNHRRSTSRFIPLDSDPPTSQEVHPHHHEVADPLPLPDEQIARWEGIGLVRLSLEALDERSREVVRLKFQEDMSYKEISRRTGLKAGHVGYLLHHALKFLAAELAKTGGVV
ncbi:MAG: sigma-70 family RNA polymerase sigma factor [Verrucomicrobia bacterium]|nr:sigma-70 family RNA polymerase sigma factor [Verrucomicrobiota bacterium]